MSRGYRGAVDRRQVAIQANIDASFMPNSAKQTQTLSTTAPEMHNGKRCLVIKQSEYVLDVLSNTTFQNFGFQVNPGNPDLFPWLSSAAGQFEMWYPRNMRFEFRPMSIDMLASTNTQTGSFMMAFQYNSILPLFASKPEYLNYEGTVEGKPSQQMALELGSLPLKEYYVKTGPTAFDDSSRSTAAVPITLASGTSFQDNRLYVPAKFQYAVNGFQNTGAVIGELWVTYEMCFMTHRLQEGRVGYEIPSAHYRLGGMSSVNVWGTSAQAQVNNNLDLTFSTSTMSLSPNISQGVYLVTYWVNGTGGSAVMPTFTATNCTLLNLGSAALQQQIGIIDTNGSRWLVTFLLQVTSRAASVTVSAGTWPTGPVNGDVLVTQWNGALVT